MKIVPMNLVLIKFFINITQSQLNSDKNYDCEFNHS